MVLAYLVTNLQMRCRRQGQGFSSQSPCHYTLGALTGLASAADALITVSDIQFMMRAQDTNLASFISVTPLT